MIYMKYGIMQTHGLFIIYENEIKIVGYYFTYCAAEEEKRRLE